ncbi:MAG: class I SAM-dependent methyltransferase [Anaerolineae bacterium]|nr:class I SAM-dependent methyltransferase [Anaerolineae bacterium]
MTILANWRHHLTPAGYDEGLGLVYERFVLNDFLLELQRRYGFHTVLEAPLFGMAGVSGINSVALAQAGCDVTLVDDNEERAEGVRRIWQELGLPVRVQQHDDFGALPFADASFDFVWEWAGLWFLKDPAALLREMARVSRRLVFVAMPNRAQVGYLLRKHLLDKAFFREVDEGWADVGRIRRILTEAGLRIVGQGVLDVPPWPDTVMPAAEVLRRLGIRSRRMEERFTGDGWHWSTMAYYLGQQPELRARVLRYAWLDRARLPWQVKAVWAHHRWLLAER